MVKQFRFKLDPVLRYRTYTMRIELMKLARAKQELFKIQETIHGIRETKRTVSATLTSKQAQGMEVARYRIYRAYLDGLDKQLADAKEHQAELARHVSERHGVVETERVKKEALELLKEDRKKRYIEMSERVEQKEADELAALRFENQAIQE